MKKMGMRENLYDGQLTRQDGTEFTRVKKEVYPRKINFRELSFREPLRGT